MLRAERPAMSAEDCEMCSLDVNGEPIPEWRQRPGNLDENSSEHRSDRIFAPPLELAIEFKLREIDADHRCSHSRS